MRSSVWVAAKPGEERRYASATGFSEHFAGVLRGEGFSILRVEFDLPPRFELHDLEVSGRVDRNSATFNPIPEKQSDP